MQKPPRLIADSSLKGIGWADGIDRLSHLAQLVTVFAIDGC